LFFLCVEEVAWVGLNFLDLQDPSLEPAKQRVTESWVWALRGTNLNFSHWDIGFPKYEADKDGVYRNCGGLNIATIRLRNEACNSLHPCICDLTLENKFRTG
jgi:hypothetical protein